MQNHLSGLIAAPFTPMGPDGSLRPEGIPALCTFLVNNGVKGAFVCGSTGEGPSLTLEEKKRVMAAWAETAPAGFATIALLGGDCARDARTLMRHARQCGIQAAAIVAPAYFPLASVEALVDYCIEIAAAEPGMPVYYYHIPVLTGAHFSMRTFLECAHGRFPNLAGIKFTHEDLMDFKSCMDFAAGRYNILWGRDEVLLAALSMGAKGAVGSTYNYAAPLYLRLIAAFEAGKLDEAARLQQQAIAFIRLLQQYGMAAGKVFMQYVGMDCGTFRPPVQNLSSAQSRALTAALDAMNFRDFCSSMEEE